MLARGRRAGADGRRARARRPRGAGGVVRGRARSPFEIDPEIAAPPARGPRRHRRDAAAVGGDRRATRPSASAAGRSRRRWHEQRDWDAASYDRVSTPQVEMAEAGARAAAAARRRDGARRRLRLRPRDRAAARAAAATGTSWRSTRRPRWSSTPARPSASAPPSSAPSLTELDARRAGRRRLLERRLPLDRRPRAAVRAPARRAQAGRPAGRAVRRQGQHRRVPAAGRRGRRRAALRRAHDATSRGPWNYASPEDTEARLRAAGFDEVRCWLQPWPVEPGDPVEFARTVCLGNHLEALPEELREPLRRGGGPPLGRSAGARIRPAQHRRTTELRFRANGVKRQSCSETRGYS